jgi:glycopeptide antibiotics resistance protein
MKRNRFLYILLIILTVACGLASRHYSSSLPLWVKLYAGDALWALMVFFLCGFVFRNKSTRWIAVASLLFSFSIEFSQLYHAPWIDAIRNTRIGALILGFGFLWSDLISYSVGISLGILVEFPLWKKKSSV